MSNQVKEILFTGPDGRLVGKYKKGQSLNPPVALLASPSPTLWWNNEQPNSNGIV
jgi:alpha/beta superfamily hydrolase